MNTAVQLRDKNDSIVSSLAFEDDHVTDNVIVTEGRYFVYEGRFGDPGSQYADIHIFRERKLQRAGDK